MAQQGQSKLKSPRTIFIAAAIAILVVVGLIVAISMRNSDADLAASENEGQVDDQVLVHYTQFCDALSPIALAPPSYYSTAEATIGLSAGERNKRFATAARNTVDTFGDSIDQLGEINDNAPEEVSTAPGDPSVSFRGALTPLIDELEGTVNELEGLATEPDFTSPDEAAGRKAIDAFGTALNRTPATVSGVLPEVLANQPIYSTATADAVRNSAECSPLLGNGAAVPEDVVIKSVVSAVERMNSAEKIYNDAARVVESTTIDDGLSLEEASNISRAMWTDLASALRESEHQIREWSNNEATNSPESVAADQMAGPLASAADAYRDAAEWADKAATRVSESSGDSNELTSEMEALSREFADEQIDIVRAQTGARTNMYLGNEATAHAVQDLNG